jgi:hypothetical protein
MKSVEDVLSEVCKYHDEAERRQDAARARKDFREVNYYEGALYALDNMIHYIARNAMPEEAAKNFFHKRNREARNERKPSE